MSGDTALALPRRPRGRPTQEAQRQYEAEVARWCDGIQEIDSLDFKVSSPGWCYVLEEHGLVKGDFDTAQKLINQCRKSGLLPLDICSEEDGRAAEHIEDLDDETPAEFAAGWVEHLEVVHERYTPVSFWEDLDAYVQMTVEKIDLKNLFAPVCKEFRVATTNISGWNDINSRAAIKRFAYWEARGKQCVLLHCGDHDPGGLHISEFIRKNLEDLSGAVGWNPDDLVIDRFGLNADFIGSQHLTWIENLETSSGGHLDDPRHPDHHKTYVQSYLAQFGVRKVEANALVVRPAAGRALCRRAILRHVPATAFRAYTRKLDHQQERVRVEIARLLGDRS